MIIKPHAVGMDKLCPFGHAPKSSEFTEKAGAFEDVRSY